MNLIKASLLTAVVTLVSAAAANASIYNNTFVVTAHEGTGSAAFNTASGDPFGPAGTNGTAYATFTFTGPLNFSNTAPQNSGPTGDKNSAFFSSGTISNYSGSGVVTSQGVGQVANFGPAGNPQNGLANFLNSSASVAGYKWGTYMTFNLGDLAKGTVLTITHDDGVSLFENGVQIGNTISGATEKVTETVTITGNSTADVFLRYSRQNGTPSILQVSVPEPMSLALLGTGLLGLGLLRRRTA